MNFQAAPDSTLAHTEADRLKAPPHTGDRHKFYSVPVPPLTLLRTTLAARSSRWSVSRSKRAVDIGGSALALLLLSPGLLLVALLVASTSRGPILFAQRRVGRLGQLFTIYKFRTMHPARHHRGPIITRSGDARVTKAGRLLRKFKIDELPQFYNVLRGDMSLVGPRPKLAQHEGMHMPFRPGITGAATLAFRCEEEMLREIPESVLESYCAHMIRPLKTRIDSEYMENATLLSDTSMILKTAAACVLPLGSLGVLPECSRSWQLHHGTQGFKSVEVE